MGRPLTTPREFLGKIQTDECWIWTGSKDKDGYGWSNFSNEKKAHRASYRFFVGPIPDGLGVLHKCDKPSCVNPKHLFLGDCAANHADMIAKDRQPKGERHRKAKLTEAQVLDIRRLYAAGETPLALSRLFNVCAATIVHVATGRTWTHLPGICKGRGLDSNRQTP